jgi:hypothetical protein
MNDINIIYAICLQHLDCKGFEECKMLFNKLIDLRGEFDLIYEAWDTFKVGFVSTICCELGVAFVCYFFCIFFLIFSIPETIYICAKRSVNYRKIFKTKIKLLMAMKAYFSNKPNCIEIYNAINHELNK